MSIGYQNHGGMTKPAGGIFASTKELQTYKYEPVIAQRRGHTELTVKR